ncbi:kinase-like domain-containing protein [Hyaloraphidium curvatum]|nr:kinase-like domain-containing protein [Hyaloraphidium curvatum]
MFRKKAAAKPVSAESAQTVESVESGEECHRRGWQYENGDGVANDLVEAAKWYCKSADQGNASGQVNLGRCYEYGWGVAKDLAEAAKWYRKSADQGNAVGQVHLGRCFENGWGVVKDLVEAAKWYRKSADQGNADGQDSLGACYENGSGVAKDLAEASRWYRKSADQGDAYGQKNLGRCYENGWGVANDLVEAAKWYRKSADQGNASGQFNLGRCYEYGWGVAKDLAEAAKWYRKSADQGNAVGQVNLGLCYENGWGVAKDLAEAAKWYRKSADQGDSYGQNHLGRCYENGWGVAKDLAEAAKWYRKAADQGNASGQVNLGRLYENGWGVAKDLAEALRWYRKSADQGNLDGQYNLALCYQFGKGVEVNLTTALDLYQKAAAQGDEDAKARVEQVQAAINVQRAAEERRRTEEAEAAERSRAAAEARAKQEAEAEARRRREENWAKERERLELERRRQEAEAEARRRREEDLAHERERLELQRRRMELENEAKARELALLAERLKLEQELAALKVPQAQTRLDGSARTAVPSAPGSAATDRTADEAGKPNLARSKTSFWVEEADISYDRSSCLGKGGFGVVYRGKYLDLTDVAVKVALDTYSTEEASVFLEAEVKVWAELPAHDNVVPLLGYRTSPTFLVTKLFTGGSMKSFLAARNWDLALALHLLGDAAVGMTFLHSKGVIHSDLKAENVLVEDGTRMPVAKIADFGLAKVRTRVEDTKGNKAYQYQGLAGATIRYAPPEFFDEEPLRKPSDVWTFGMMCYQVLSGGRDPFSDLTNPPAVMKAIFGGKRPPRPDNVPDAVWSLMQSCWKEEMGERPTMAENFVDFHRCAKAKGDDFPPCLAFKKAYLSLCPSAWVEKWTEQLENGTFPAKGLVEEKHGHDDGHGHH